MKSLNCLNRIRFLKAASILLLILRFSVFSQSSDIPYEFPVKPGTPEWKEFKSHTEMINACQIPADEAKKMSTKGLITTCLNYPLFGDVFAYNDFQLGFERMSSKFNGLKELLQRSDIGETALQEYKDMFDSGSPEARDFSIKWRYRYLEILLSQKQVYRNLSNQKKKLLIYEALKKFSAKQSRSDIYGLSSLTTSCIVMARLLEGNVNSGNHELDLKVSKFTQKPFTADAETVNAVTRAAKKYLSN